MNTNYERIILKSGAKLITNVGTLYTVQEDFDSQKDSALIVLHGFFQVVICLTTESLCNAFQRKEIKLFEQNAPLEEVCTDISSYEGDGSGTLLQDASCMELEKFSHDMITDGCIVGIKPYPDESFQSVLERLAAENFVDLYAIKRVYAPHLKLPIRYTEANINYASRELYESQIKDLFATQEDFEKLTLNSIAKEIVTETHSNLERDYIFRMTHSKFCPICLSEEMYHRLLWDINFFCVCLKHQVYLVDVCSSCNSRVYVYNITHGVCSCGHDLRSTNTSKPNDFVLTAQKVLQDLLQGHADIKIPAGKVTKKQFFYLLYVFSRGCEKIFDSLINSGYTELSMKEVKSKKGQLITTSKSDAVISSSAYHFLRDPQSYVTEFSNVMTYANRRIDKWTDKLLNKEVVEYYFDVYTAQQMKLKLEEKKKPVLDENETAEFLGLRAHEVTSLCDSDVLTGKKVKFYNDWEFQRKDVEAFMSSYQTLAKPCVETSLPLVGLRQAVEQLFENRMKLHMVNILKLAKHHKIRLYIKDPKGDFSQMYLLEEELIALLEDAYVFVFGYTFVQAAELLEMSAYTIKFRFFTEWDKHRLLHGGNTCYISKEQIDDFLRRRDRCRVLV